MAARPGWSQASRITETPLGIPVPIDLGAETRAFKGD